MIRNVDQAASNDLPARRRALSERYDGWRMGVFGAVDPGGRPRETNMREAINAILYLLRTGCPWRYLPREGFPPRSTVYNIFRNFQKAGVWDAIWERLHMELREDMEREASPTAAIIDSQSVKSAEKGAAMMA